MNRSAIRRLGALVAVSGAMAGAGIGLASSASAATPTTQEYFICPSVSTHNARGTWVIGGHGAYYVLVPTKGPNGGKVYLTVPTTVLDRAQVPAGWALYKDVIDTTASDGTLVFTTADASTDSAMLLAEGLKWFPGAEAAGWAEGDQITVTADGTGGYEAENLGNPMMGVGPKGTIQLSEGAFVPAAAGAIW